MPPLHVNRAPAQSLRAAVPQVPRDEFFKMDGFDGWNGHDWCGAVLTLGSLSDFDTRHFFRDVGAHYREFPVCAELADHFLCLWTQSVDEGGPAYCQRVLPDACIDLIWVDDSEPVIVGPWTEPFLADLPAGTTIVGARWHPGRAAGLLRVAASELINRFVPLRDVLGSRAHARFACVGHAADPGARRTALEAVLRDYSSRPQRLDRVVCRGVAWLANNPHVRIEQLSQYSGMTTRQLHRRFATAIGYGPKLFQSVLRFQRLLHIASRPRRRLAEMSVTAGYADQAHMTREVQRFAGVVPSALLSGAESTLVLSGLIEPRPKA